MIFIIIPPRDIPAGGDLAVYKDAGYSGKNTKRPDFERLLRDIKADKVKKLSGWVCLIFIIIPPRDIL